jgi:hypothetical protein
VIPRKKHCVRLDGVYAGNGRWINPPRTVCYYSQSRGWFDRVSAAACSQAYACY